MFDSVPPNLPTVGSSPVSSPSPALAGATPPAAAAPPGAAPATGKPAAAGSPLVQEEHVTVMPSKFFVPPKARLPWKKIGLVTLVVLVGGAAIIGVSMLVQWRLVKDQPANPATPPPEASAPAPAVSTSSTPPSSPTPSGQTPTPGVETPPAPSTPPATPPSPPTGDANPPGVTPPATPPQLDAKDTPLAPSVDSDSDGLSDAEEVVFGTNPNVPDTDQDSFADGKEVLNLFSPNSPDASKKIWETTVVNKYHHPSIGYELLYPSAWVARSTSSTGEEIVFTSPTGPSITVSATVNTQGLTAQEWYLKQNPSTPAAQLKTVTSKSGVSGVVSPTGLVTVFDIVSNSSRWIVKIQYHASGETVATYRQFYGMMVNSFQVPTLKAFWNF